MDVVIGSLLTALIGSYVRSKIGMWVPKLTSLKGEFEEIEWEGLAVVDAKGNAQVILISDFGAYFSGQQGNTAGVTIFMVANKLGESMSAAKIANR